MILRDYGHTLSIVIEKRVIDFVNMDYEHQIK